MKRILSRSWLIFIVVIAFLIGIGYLVIETVFNAADWVDKPYNGHASGAGGLLDAGVIYDRNGEILAQTIDDERVYNEDQDVREALLHVVGDNSLNISTAVQSQFRSHLTGYSFIWGMDMPKSFRDGRDVKLTVDAKTCKTAYNALNQYDSGACVIYNYNTGEILCQVSVKSYDPQAPPEITKKNESEYEGVYLDNVLSSTYTPGSIFKIVTAAAAIENIDDIWERTWDCEGKEEIGGSDVTCVDAHGTVNLEQAFGDSCNVVFAELAVELGEDIMNKTARRMGINASFDISGIKTAKGHFDVKNAETNFLAWSGVGQYDNKVNPMQMAILCGAIARDGKPMIPYLFSGASGSILTDMGISTKGSEGDSLMSKNTADSLRRLMRYAVENDYGDYMFGDLTVCAKTGTGEILTGGDADKNDGWMVGFSTDDDAPLAFACVVRGSGEYGYSTAGQVAAEAMQQAAASLREKN
jgi:peptidoglycan glycosyltransferase